MAKVSYSIKWTNEFTEDFISDFIRVENEVLYGGQFTRDLFNLKYCEDIYGQSVLIVAYCDEKAVGSYALWRNDIDGKEAYQSVDSCVIQEYQGLLIFPEMINKLKAQVPKECPIYGFPNSEATPIVKLMKHKILGTYRTRFLFSYRIFHKEHQTLIPYDYAKWWIINYDKSIYSTKIGSHLFLVKKHKTKGTLFVVGEVNEETAALFPKISGLFIPTYYSSVPTFYNKNKKGIIIVNQRNIYADIPTWKVDAV